MGAIQSIHIVWPGHWLQVLDNSTQLNTLTTRDPRTISFNYTTKEGYVDTDPADGHYKTNEQRRTQGQTDVIIFDNKPNSNCLKIRV